jgi:hypothetical protein
MSKINKYYKTQQQKINKIININLINKINFSKDRNNLNIIELYDNKVYLKAIYEIVGIYNYDNFTWYWSYYSPFINATISHISLNIKNNKYDTIFDKLFNNKEFNNKDIQKYKKYISQPYFIIDKNELYKLMIFILYISKQYFIFPIEIKKSKNEFIIIKNILQIMQI